MQEAFFRCWKCNKKDVNIITGTHNFHCALVWRGNADGCVTASRPLHAATSPHFELDGRVQATALTNNAWLPFI